MPSATGHEGLFSSALGASVGCPQTTAPTRAQLRSPAPAGGLDVEGGCPRGKEAEVESPPAGKLAAPLPRPSVAICLP